MPTVHRIDWVDLAKGICIIFVVMVHSTLGVEKAMGQEGWMHQLVAFARPFRMPDFFMISGLFLGLVIDRPMTRYVDRKVIHFAYFYALWLTIQFVFKAPGIAAEQGWSAAVGLYLWSYIQPFGTLWFIYILPVFFLFTRLVRTLPVWFVLIWAIVMEALPFHTGWVSIDEFAARYVYFFIGYAFAANIFTIAAWLRERPVAALALLAAWAPLNAVAVFTPAPASTAYLLQPETGFSGATGGLSELPGISFMLGLAGALAIVGVASLLVRLPWANWLSWLGAHSIVVYLAFFLPMAVTRVALVKTGLIADVGTVSLLANIAGVAGPVVLYGMIQWTGYGRFLFTRPAWLSIDRTSNAQSGPIALAK